MNSNTPRPSPFLQIRKHVDEHLETSLLPAANDPASLHLIMSKAVADSECYSSMVDYWELFSKLDDEVMSGKLGLIASYLGQIKNPGLPWIQKDQAIASLISLRIELSKELESVVFGQADDLIYKELAARNGDTPDPSVGYVSYE